MIVLFGASGRVGSLVAARLAAANTPIRCVTRDPAAARTKLPPAAEIIAAEFADPASLERALAGAQRALIVTPIHVELVSQQIAIVRAAHAAGVERVVKLSGSSWTMTGERTATIGRAHLAVEQALFDARMPAVIVRPNAFMQGFWAKAKADAAATGRFATPIGSAPIACIDIRDLADVLANALLSNEPPLATPIEITGPSAIDSAGFAALLGAVLGRPVEVEPINIDAIVERERARGTPPFILNHLSEMYTLIAAGLAAGVTDRLAAVLGRPARTIEEYARA